MGKTSKPFRKNQSCLLAAAIGMTLASCSDDATEQLAPQNVQQQTPTAILFSNVANTVTRASHTESAALLKNSIVFYGDKTTSAVQTPSSTTTVCSILLVLPARRRPMSTTGSMWDSPLSRMQYRT